MGFIRIVLAPRGRYGRSRIHRLLCRNKPTRILRVQELYKIAGTVSTQFAEQSCNWCLLDFHRFINRGSDNHACSVLSLRIINRTLSDRSNVLTENFLLYEYSIFIIVVIVCSLLVMFCSYFHWAKVSP